MRLRLEPSTRFPQVPAWTVAIVAVWVFCVALITVLSAVAQRDVVTCHVRALTGVPCPTCGSTRAVLALFDGRWLDAFLFNPFVITATAIAVPLGLVRLVAKHAVRFDMSRSAARLVWSGVTALFIMNWVYVWQYHRTPDRAAVYEQPVLTSDVLLPFRGRAR